MKLSDSKYLLFQLLWFLILMPKPVQFILLVMYLFVVIVSHKVKFKLDFISMTLFGYSLVHVISIIVRTVIQQNVTRVGAAINTSLVMVLATIVYIIVTNVHFDERKISKYMFINMNIMVCLAFLFALRKYAGFPLPSSFLGRVFYRDDWLDGVHTFRLTALLEFDNLIPMFYLVCGVWALTYVRNKFKFPFLVFYVLMMFLPVYLSNSRMGLVLVGLTTFALIFTSIKSIKMKILLTSIGTALVIGVGIYEIDTIVAAITEIFYSRSNSNNMRMMIYELSIKTALEESPLIGMGVKSMLGHYPLGSHSSYIGFFYKTGIIGSFFMLLFLFYVGKQALRLIKQDKQNYLFGIFNLAILVSMITTDIDATNWLITVFMANVGFLINKVREGQTTGISSSSREFLENFSNYSEGNLKRSL